MAAGCNAIGWASRTIVRARRRRARGYRRQRHGLAAMRDCFDEVTGGMYMSGWTRGSLFAALKAAGVASILGWVLVLSAGPALADPDPAPGDPGVVAPPAGPPAPPPVVAGPGGGQDPTPFT